MNSKEKFCNYNIKSKLGYTANFGGKHIDFKHFSNDKRIFNIPIYRNGGPSTGERNLMVLFYDLLNNMDSNRLIICDEPEISLHIVAQERIISTIEEVLVSPFKEKRKKDYANDAIIYSGIDIKNKEIIVYKYSLATQLVFITHSPNICRGYDNCMIEFEDLK